MRKAGTPLCVGNSRSHAKRLDLARHDLGDSYSMPAYLRRTRPKVLPARDLALHYRDISWRPAYWGSNVCPSLKGSASLSTRSLPL